jgi:hypothetical protein
MFEWTAGSLLAIGVIGIVILVIISLAWLLAYVLISAGLFVIAKKRGVAHYGLAWVPFFRYYLLGTLLRNELAITPKIRIPYFQFILPASSVLSMVGGGFGSLFSIIFIILIFLAYSSLFRQYREPNAIVYGILACIPVIEVIGGVFIYTLAEKPAPAADADATVFP